MEMGNGHWEDPFPLQSRWVCSLLPCDVFVFRVSSISAQIGIGSDQHVDHTCGDGHGVDRNMSKPRFQDSEAMTPRESWKGRRSAVGRPNALTPYIG